MSKSAVVGGCLLIISLFCLGMACQSKQAIENATPLVITVEVPVTVEVTRVELIEVTAVPPTMAAPTREALVVSATGVFTATHPTIYVPLPPGTNCPGMTQLDMNTCAAERAYESARVVDEILSARLEDPFWPDQGRDWSYEGPDALLISQAHWDEYKQDYCAWQAQLFAAGSMQPQIYSDCVYRHNQARIEELCLYAYAAIPACASDTVVISTTPAEPSQWPGYELILCDGLGNPAMLACGSDWIVETEQLLEQIIAALIEEKYNQHNLPPDWLEEYERLLTTSQSEFETYKADYCQWQAYTYQGGAEQGIAHLACLARLNLARINEMLAFSCSHGSNISFCRAGDEDTTEE
jgi:hypothetical protein